MTPFTKEYIDNLNWQLHVDNEECMIWYKKNFEVTYYKKEDNFYIHIDDNHNCTLGESRIEYVEEFQLFLEIYKNPTDVCYDNISLLDRIVSRKEFVKVPEDYDFRLTPVNTPYRWDPEADIIILYDEFIGEIEFMFHNMRTEVVIQNDNQFEKLYEFYKTFE